MCRSALQAGGVGNATVVKLALEQEPAHRQLKSHEPCLPRPSMSPSLRRILPSAALLLAIASVGDAQTPTQNDSSARTATRTTEAARRRWAPWGDCCQPS